MAHSFVSGVEVDGHTVDPHPEDAQHCKVAAADDEHLNIYYPGQVITLSHVIYIYLWLDRHFFDFVLISLVNPTTNSVCNTPKTYK